MCELSQLNYSIIIYFLTLYLKEWCSTVVWPSWVRGVQGRAMHMGVLLVHALNEINKQYNVLKILQQLPVLVIRDSPCGC